MIIDKELATKISNRVNQLVTETIEREFGVKVCMGSGRYSNTTFTKKIEFLVPVDKIESPTIFPGMNKQVTDAMIQAMVAPAGTKCFSWEGEPVTIIKPKRTNYVFVFDSKPTEQRVARARFFKAGK